MKKAHSERTESHLAVVMTSQENGGCNGSKIPLFLFYKVYKIKNTLAASKTTSSDFVAFSAESSLMCAEPERQGKLRLLEFSSF